LFVLLKAPQAEHVNATIPEKEACAVEAAIDKWISRSEMLKTPTARDAQSLTLTTQRSGKSS
jgi:hypothetical protein